MLTLTSIWAIVASTHEGCKAVMHHGWADARCQCLSTKIAGAVLPVLADAKKRVSSLK
jgi:hypothetical protein